MRKPERYRDGSEHFFSLRVRLIAAFAVFTVLVLAILWLFQTVLLDDIYRTLKLNEAETCAERIEQDVRSGKNIEQIADSYAKEYAVCISAYEIAGSGGYKNGRLLCRNHVNSFCYIHNVPSSSDLLNELYREAVQNGGEVLRRNPIAEMFRREPGHSPMDAGENVIYVKLIPQADSELLFLLNTELVPLNSTVETLRSQLLIISVILFAAAVVMAVFLSHKLSKPIREMSEEASKLALGNYNVNFDGGNCKETVMLSSTLNRAAYELSKLDKMQKDLIANVSHDLRTPLTMIAGYTEAMRDLPGEATPENMQIVIDETNRLTSLVNDMLEVSRYQGGTQVLHPARFNFTEVIRTTLGRYGKLREKEGYTIRFEADRDVFVEADEGRILQVVYNLINNAVNYTGEDKTVVIRQTVTDDDAAVLTEVIDTGIGIAKEDLPLVWERYYKVNDFHKRANMGTGLGLSIVKNILLLHGAEFGVNSKVGHGSNFWFKLKISE
ncbi:MAG: HAMP domain-containing protein [Ruminococcaceae bacterium]|nr:HAMP domain-containing protein [Oscillospiraceae bacterium]